MGKYLNEIRKKELEEQKSKEIQIQELTQKNEALEQNQSLTQKALDDLLLGGM